MKYTPLIVGGMVLGGVLLVAMSRRSSLPEDTQIDPQFGAHRGLAFPYAGNDQQPDRMPSAQDQKGGAADYLGYPYAGTAPSTYAKGEPAQVGGAWWDTREADWASPEVSPIDYGKPPLRIPKLWKDANRYWDGITSWGGTDVVDQHLHLFHLRPSAPTRGYRSISGVLAPLGGGSSTASNVRIPAVFVPSAVA